jgi:subtilisin family serine protease
LSTIPGNDDASVTGTSPAAAQVSAAVALLLARKPHLSAAEVRARLLVG